jgi:aarF domain-containing kinase
MKSFVDHRPRTVVMLHHLRNSARPVVWRQQSLSYGMPGRVLVAGAERAMSTGDDVPFDEYTHDANRVYWETRPVTVATRLAEVGASLGVWFAAGSVSGQDPHVRAARLKKILTNLGPAYIKIGQAVSSRPDVLSPEFLAELEKLQDRLPPFPTDEALQVIQNEYGKNPADIFSYLSPEPVAAASLGQVYRGVLHNGEEVAVKVQRPGVKASISLDVLVLRRLAKELRAWRKLNTNLPLLIDEWAASLFKELDYRQEARNGMRFKELYSHLDGVYIPDMYPDLTTRKVLVMEWIDGERLHTTMRRNGGSSDVEDDIRLVEIGVRCSLEQLLEFGFYHADPHPGNLLRTKDGKLAYLDFGMMGEVDENIRRGLIQATLHLVNREYSSLANDFITLGMLPKDSDQEKIVPALTSVFAEALAGGVNNLSFGDLSANLGRTMYEFKFQIPSYYTLLVRSLSVLEGIALVSNPNYKVLSAAYPWVARRLLTDTTPELQATLLSLVYKDGKLNFKRLESLFTQATRSTGLPQRPKDAPTGSPPPRGDALALILSEDGQFVRNIVVDELAKGADALWRVAIDSVIFSAYGEIHAAMASNNGQYNLSFLRNLADTLTSIPTLSDEADQEQLDGLNRLATVLQKTSAAQQEQEAPPSLDESQDASDNQTRCNAQDYAESLIKFADWAVREAETLTPDQRTRALQLPFDIAQNASSRVAARAVRWIFSNNSN